MTIQEIFDLAKQFQTPLNVDFYVNAEGEIKDPEILIYDHYRTFNRKKISTICRKLEKIKMNNNEIWAKAEVNGIMIKVSGWAKCKIVNYREIEKDVLIPSGKKEIVKVPIYDCSEAGLEQAINV